MVVRFAILLGLLILSAAASAKGLDARVDRNQVGMGEQIELTLTLTDIRGERPNTNDLLKDFSIDRQSQTSNVRIINGVVNQQASWTFLLSPHRKGKLTIPVFKVDRFSSDPIEVTVTDMPVAQSTSDDVLMEVELSPDNPYVKSQVAYIQRLYFSRPLVDSASISNPKLSQGEADVEFWGSSEPRYVTHNNRPYQLIERYYIIYPRKAGVLEFEPSVFNGSLASSRRRNDFQRNMFRAGTRVNAYSDKASIEVKEKPASYIHEHWLPATDLTVNMNLSQPVDTLKAGEPVTITIALMAEGLKAEVLPEVKLNLPENIKSYPDKPTFRTDKVRNGMVGLRQEKVVLIANEAGEYTLPEVKIPWWSVTEDKLKFATLDPVMFKVAAGAMPFNSQSNIQAADTAALEPSADEAVIQKQRRDEGAEEKSGVANSENNSLLTSYRSSLLEFYDQHKQAIGIGLIAVTAGLLFAWVFWRRRQARLNSDDYLQQVAKDEAARILNNACQSNDLSLAIAALPKWAESVGIHPSTMAGVESAGNAGLNAAIKEMTAANYSSNPIPWNGKSLSTAVSQYSEATQTTNSTRQGLMPLHPVSS